MRIPSQKRSRATFNRIVEATRTALEEGDRDEFSLKRDVVENANIPFPTIYQYFKNKEELLNYVWPGRKDIYLDSNYIPPKPGPEAKGLKGVPSTSKGQAALNRIVEAPSTSYRQLDATVLA